MPIQPFTMRLHPTALDYATEPDALPAAQCTERTASSGKPGNPPPETPSRPQHEEGVDVEDKPKSAVPRRYQVIFHNDDYTTMEFVILALTKFFHKNETESLHLMLTIHRKGSGVAGIYPRDVAETKVEQVTAFAREHGMPLLVTAEPE